MTDKSYLDFVRFRARANPCITGLYEYLRRKSHTESRIVYLDYPHNQTWPTEIEPVSASEHDLVHLIQTIEPSTTRFLFVENITSAMVATLGESLDIDPLFFTDYIHTLFQNDYEPLPQPSLATLPSLMATNNHIHLHYYQSLALNRNDGQGGAPYALKTSSNVPRNVRRLAGRDIGVARACCSFIVKAVGASRICLYLVDAPITSVEELNSETKKTYQVRVLHGGFEDFGTPPPFSSFSQGEVTGSLDKTSMLNSIIHYFRAQPPPGFHIHSPSILSVGYYPIRIVLAEWNLYSHLTSRYLKYYEYSTRNNGGPLRDEHIVDLQRWRRLSKCSQHRLDLLAEVIISHMQKEDEEEPWALLLKDANWLREQLHDYSHCLEQMVTVATSIVQLLDSRRSILATVNMRRLTYIALVFIPLSWVASLFSMSDGYSPGHDLFWVYFATALPLLGIVLLICALPYDQIDRELRHFWGEIGRVRTGMKVSQTPLGDV